MAALRRSANRLEELSLVRITADSVVAAAPDTALGALVDAEAQRLRTAQQSLSVARSAIADYRAEMQAGAHDGAPATVLDPVVIDELRRGRSSRAI